MGITRVMIGYNLLNGLLLNLLTKYPPAQPSLGSTVVLGDGRNPKPKTASSTRRAYCTTIWVIRGTILEAFEVFTVLSVVIKIDCYVVVT